MELEFVWKATRRYWAVVAVCGLLGVAAAVLLAPSVAVRYQSTALVLILSGEGGSAGDRYVSSELVILQSPPIAERAAELAGVSMSPSAIAENVTFAQIPGTDVVRIIAASPSPTEAQAIANGYVDAYLDARSALGSADQNIDAGPAESESHRARRPARRCRSAGPGSDGAVRPGCRGTGRRRNCPRFRQSKTSLLRSLSSEKS